MPSFACLIFFFVLALADIVFVIKVPRVHQWYDDYDDYDPTRIRAIEDRIRIAVDTAICLALLACIIIKIHLQG